jgi:hypothetical protein
MSNVVVVPGMNNGRLSFRLARNDEDMMSIVDNEIVLADYSCDGRVTNSGKFVYMQMKIVNGVRKNIRDARRQSVVYSLIKHCQWTSKELRPPAANIFINFYVWSDDDDLAATVEAVRDTDLGAFLKSSGAVKVLAGGRKLDNDDLEVIQDLLSNYSETNISVMSKAELDKWLIPAFVSIPRIVAGIDMNI